MLDRNGQCFFPHLEVGAIESPGNQRQATQAQRVQLANGMPQDLEFDSPNNRLHVGDGYIDNVTPNMWEFEVSGKKVVSQWFSYRRKNRERPPMGDKRPPSPLSSLQPDEWLDEYTTELINVLNVVGLLIEMDSTLDDLLGRVLINGLISVGEFSRADALRHDEIPLPAVNSAKSQLSLL